MSTAPLQTTATKSQPLSKSAHAGLLLQRTPALTGGARECVCGGNAGPSGECAECHQKRMVSQPSLIQPKLTIGQPNDPYEHAADRVADTFMRMPEPKVQRQADEDEKEDDKEETIQAKPIAGQITPLVQRQTADEEKDEEDETVQTKASPDQTPEVTPGIEANINALKGGGQSLNPATRAFMEPRFGHDFSQVRVHTDAKAAESARAVNALAYTLGKDIAFGATQYAPGTSQGRKLLAHELTHVIQQSRAGDSIQKQAEQPVQQPDRCALTTHNGANFSGEDVVADNEFVDSLNTIDNYAGNNRVQIVVTHSFREVGQSVRGAIVPPAEGSNHLAGHAIDMNVMYRRTLYNSRRLRRANLPNLPTAVRNFINDIRDDAALRWGGDFGTQDPVHIDDGLNQNRENWNRRYIATQGARRSGCG